MSDWLLGMSLPNYRWLFAGVLLGAVTGLVLLWTGWRRLRLVEDVPTSKIRSAAQGVVELQGTARALPGPELVAPGTQIPCLWYRYRLEERVHHGQHDSWRTVESRTSGDLFLIEDETGRSIIDPDDAEVISSATDSGWRGTDRRWKEERIIEGDPLYVMGEFQTHSAVEEQTLREDLRALLAAWKRDPARMRAFDANGDGQIDAQEWEAARKAAQEQVLLERAERSKSLGAYHVLRRPADGRHPYIISTVPEDRLLRRFRWQTWGGLVLLLGAAGLAAYMWILRNPLAAG